MLNCFFSLKNDFLLLKQIFLWFWFFWIIRLYSYFSLHGVNFDKMLLIIVFCDLKLVRFFIVYTKADFIVWKVLLWFNLLCVWRFSFMFKGLFLLDLMRNLIWCCSLNPKICKILVINLGVFLLFHKYWFSFMWDKVRELLIGVFNLNTIVSVFTLIIVI